ncbi:glycoside hydrolase [Blastopirellula sp. JC732]|uniref:Glycoside hydrolase n=1 Tax=Blastopirellula sediminis TaxID=2894196 RepID=A0A9X1SGB2_9BACT|nr:sialidase family protein [Blastopirellula sediminis]MCC9608727.1 glycoside hydrolase [Blastopirellula sediminis]MCC9628496.1 glycoside hydrolase [Blastopirellula sediminis]
MTRPISILSCLLAMLAVGEFDSVKAETPTSSVWNGTPVSLTANEMSIATGQPSLVLMSSGSTHVPVWSLSGGTVGQSVSGVVDGFPSDVAAVKVEIVVTTNDKETSSDFSDVYRVHLSQMVEGAPFTARNFLGDVVRTTLPPAPLYARTILLESYYEVKPHAPITVRVQREPGDPADTFTRPTGLALVRVTPLPALAKPLVVQEGPGYDSWPMMQAMGDKLVCTYSRGSGHTIGEDARAVYARTSTDQGKSWTPETVVANSPGYGDVTVGKGLDSTGAMLLWVRRVGKQWHHDLYRTTDGVKFELIATPEMEVTPIQITDVIDVPTVGLMALWFAGSYGDPGPNHSWGTLTSSDDGKTWKQNVIEAELTKENWPTEPSAVYLGDGKLLAIGRTEVGGNSTTRSQFQMVSTDYGATWKRSPTNISDVVISTPSLILDADTGLLSNYYYQRGPRGLLRRRVVDPNFIFDHPQSWPASEAIAAGSQLTVDAGNANATWIGDKHFISYYSGAAPDTSVFVAEVPAPQAEK